MTETARSDPPDAGAWDDRYGSGRIDAAGAVTKLSDTAQKPAS